MGARRPDPTRLDVAALASEGASLSGQWTASELPRWHTMQTPAAGAATAPVMWDVRGEQRRVGAAQPQTWLHLHVTTTAWPTCQRCLQPFSQALEIERALRFVASEAEAEALDADSEDDVLALAPAFDLRTLVEDELLLAWPIVPRHDQCSAPQHHAGDDEGAATAAPFAALAALKAPSRSR
jgi:uncharacterized protein